MSLLTPTLEPRSLPKLQKGKCFFVPPLAAPLIILKFACICFVSSAWVGRAPQEALLGTLSRTLLLCYLLLLPRILPQGPCLVDCTSASEIIIFLLLFPMKWPRTGII